MENNIDNADNFLLKRNDIIREPSYSERMFWAELLVEYGKLLQSPVSGSVCDGCGSKFDAMDIALGVCYCCQKEIKQIAI